MTQILPWMRFVGTFFLIIAAFINFHIGPILLIYAMVLLLVILSGIAPAHTKFVIYFGIPTGLALWIVWGWAYQASAPIGFSGNIYALRSWLRILICAGAIQFLFLPLIEKPTLFKSFVHTLGIPHSFGILILSSIFFLPEVKRRLNAIFEARKVQGYQTSGLKGLISLPVVLMPLVSSLLLSSLQRGEFWTHRNVIGAQSASFEYTYNKFHGLLFIFGSIAFVVIGIVHRAT